MFTRLTRVRPYDHGFTDYINDVSDELLNVYKGNYARLFLANESTANDLQTQALPGVIKLRCWIEVYDLFIIDIQNQS